jgi:hypothetical protein
MPSLLFMKVWCLCLACIILSGYESAGPLRACVKVADYYDPFSTGTLTHVKSLEAFVRAFLPPYLNDSQ